MFLKCTLESANDGFVNGISCIRAATPKDNIRFLWMNIFDVVLTLNRSNTKPEVRATDQSALRL